MSHIAIKLDAEYLVRQPAGANPCRGIDRYPGVTRERDLSICEAKRLEGGFDAALEPAWIMAPSPPTKKRIAGPYEDWRAVACIKLLLFTWAHVSEILSLKWEYIDWQRGIARLTDSKTGRRNLAVTTPAIELLNWLPGDSRSPYVLPGNKPGTTSSVSKSLGSVCAPRRHYPTFGSMTCVTPLRPSPLPMACRCSWLERYRGIAMP